EPVQDASPTPSGDFFWKADFERVDVTVQATRARATMLGPVPAVGELSPTMAAAYQTLISPLEPLRVHRGGLGARGAYARSAAGRTDALRAVLRGPNPEARALAAVVLNEAHALDAADRDTIRALAMTSPKLAVGLEGSDHYAFEESGLFFQR